MSIKGNVISCDECGRQISMPMELESGGKQSLDERVRDHATQEGWTSTDQRHICPDHDAEEPTPIEPEAELLGSMDQPKAHLPSNGYEENVEG